MRVIVLNGVNLTVTEADVFVILGPNGCGKSTFLKCLNLLEPYQQGEVLLRGNVVSRGRPLHHLPTRAEERDTQRLRHGPTLSPWGLEARVLRGLRATHARHVVVNR